MKDKLQEAEIKLSNGATWKIVHNLPGAFGMNIQCALDNYLARERKPNISGFCKYIESKDPNFKAMPRSEFDKIK